MNIVIDLPTPEAISELVPGFLISASLLREKLDLIGNLANTGIEVLDQIFASAPSEMQRKLQYARSLFGQVGFTSDAVVEDGGDDLNEVWAVASTT